MRQHEAAVFHLERVSVIIPCYNNERYVAEAIESALGQQYKNLEVIVIDDGSTDGSLEIIQSFGSRIVWRTGANKGACAARNTGLELASGRFILYLDADDFLLPGAVARQVECLASCQPEEFACGRTFRLEEDLGLLLPHGSRDAARVFRLSIQDVIVDVPVVSAQLWPRHILQKLGGFDEALKVRQDFDLFIRALLAGYSPKSNPTQTFCYRNHSTVGRISRKKSDHFPHQLAMYRSYSKLWRKLAVSERKNEIGRGLAQSIWVTGRNALRLDFKELAAEFFDLAKQFDSRGAVCGKFPYKLLVSAVGALRAEAALTKIKIARRRTP